MATRNQQLRDAERKYCSKLTQYGENDQGTLRAEIVYRDLKCARTACNNAHQDCVHTHDKRKYCASCARKINEHNPSDPPLITFPEITRGKNKQES